MNGSIGVKELNKHTCEAITVEKLSELGIRVVI